MNPLIFTAQPVHVRPHHLETPRSYLARMCVANVINPRVVALRIAERRRRTGIRDQLATVIHELGGPRPSRFVRSYLAVTRNRVKMADDVDTILNRAYRRPRTVRHACTFCSAGQMVETFDHDRFCICLKHGRWLAPGRQVDDQRQVPDRAEWVSAERRHRRAVANGLLTRQLADGAWKAVCDQATMLGPASWVDRLCRAVDQPGYTVGVDDRLALFPQTTKVLQLLAMPSTWFVLDRLFQSPGQLTNYLVHQLDWIPGQVGVLAEVLVDQLIRSRRSRLAELNILLSPYFANEPVV
jgi:hypothetical protein